MEKETWQIGKNGGCVVSDIKPNRPSYSDKDYKSEKEYYGGYIIAESIPNKKTENIIAAAPDMLEALIAFKDNVDNWLKTGISADPETSKAIYDKAKAAIKKATSNV